MRVDEKDETREAWDAVKAAVRGYARDPSDEKAVAVQAAWQKVRRLDDLHARCQKQAY